MVTPCREIAGRLNGRLAAREGVCASVSEFVGAGCGLRAALANRRRWSFALPRPHSRPAPGFSESP